MLAFLYGSNMSSRRLKMPNRCPSAEFVTIAYVSDYRFKFNKVSNKGGRNGKANIVLTNLDQDFVWGVVFNIAPEEKAALDRAEGLGNGYDEIELTVRDTLGNNFAVTVYIGTNLDDNLRPFDWYKEHCERGAIEFDLPHDYVIFLRSFRSQDCPSEIREEELAIYS